MCRYNEFITKCRVCQEVIRVFKSGWEYCNNQGRCSYKKIETFVRHDTCDRCRSVRY
ncbi:hypothetical protein GGS23DRAFT_555721 [Durotheca rogersii]|uniref:uncharacterized protein n=1 Tax=Durotheca rogersii TaxID=419775 RepID=UPI00221FEE87|nr:uncharacterized protein GGS23DRAFT_555721 [Durotheca rogersii]KAI5866143.1 hypothetical protein GGS23DRAFT_555721 [Durotheca rogersii]